MSFPYQEAGWRGVVAKWGAAVKGTIPEKQFRVPFNPSQVQIEKAGYSYEKMTIWKETINALNLEIEIPEELRYYLGISNKLGLFRIDNSKLREVARNAPKKEELGYQPVVGFQDAVSQLVLCCRKLLTETVSSPPCQSCQCPRRGAPNAKGQGSTSPFGSSVPRKSHHHRSGCLS